jgi:hypothetical protein
MLPVRKSCPCPMCLVCVAHMDSGGLSSPGIAWRTGPYTLALLPVIILVSAKNNTLWLRRRAVGGVVLGRWCADRKGCVMMLGPRSWWRQVAEMESLSCRFMLIPGSGQSLMVRAP